MTMRLAGVLLLAAFAAPAPISAATGRPVPVGVRAIGMGGAAVAAPRDVSAIFWNPAALAALDHHQVAGTRADLFGTGLRHNDVAAALPLRRGRTLGFGWFHAGADDGELDYAENRFELAGGAQVRAGLSVGASLKYLTRSLDIDGFDSGRGRGAGLDVGMQWRPLSTLHFGAALQDATNTRVDYDGADSVPVYERALRAGLDWQAAPPVRVAAQLDDQWRIGGEVTPTDGVAFRAGLRQALKESESPIWSVGAGLTVGPIQFDYAREMHPVLDDTQYFGVSFSFQYNPSLLTIEEVRVEELFVSLYRSYASAPPVTVRLRNESSQALEARLRCDLPDVGGAYGEMTILLRPGVATEVGLPLVIDESALRASGDRNTEVRVSARYVGPRAERRESAGATALVYGPGAIDWDRGVEQAAAFVTADDPAIARWARQTLRAVSPADSLRFGSGRMAAAAALFTGLRQAGLRYVPDPLNPYSAVSAGRRAVDSVHYPRQTMALRTGDCDDTSLLLAALLHNVGVETRLVDLPGHLMLLIDTGVHPRHRLALEPEASLLVEHEGRLWAPFETTALGGGFESAWRQGAAAYADATARGRARLVNLVAAQVRYGPPTFRSEPGEILPEAGNIADELDREGRRIDARRTARGSLEEGGGER
jgi:hypothetical protein